MKTTGMKIMFIILEFFCRTRLHAAHAKQECFPCSYLYKWLALQLEKYEAHLFMTFTIVLLHEHLTAATGLEPLLCLSGTLGERHGTLTHRDKCPTAPTL